MKHSGNTMFITGATSGIGRALAEAFHKLGNTVIIAGRRQALLDEITAANPGMHAINCNVGDAATVPHIAEQLCTKYPELNVLFNNAGIMRAERLDAAEIDTQDAEQTIATNLLAPIRLTATLLPHLRSQPQSTIINTTSGLAFVPMALTPTYSATKAGLHAYTEALRFQMRDTTTEVIELIPPYVATDLMNGASDPNAMPLHEFISETMSLFLSEPTPAEICVERVKPLRNASKNGNFEQIFQGMNEAAMAR